MSLGKDDGTVRDYRRNRISDWLLEALEKASHRDELAVYGTEARATASYERLVRYLIGNRRLDDARRDEQQEGIEKTAEKLPGHFLESGRHLG